MSELKAVRSLHFDVMSIYEVKRIWKFILGALRTDQMSIRQSVPLPSLQTRSK
jgi:hypothetical protein